MYKPGKDNKTADVLNRKTDYMKDKAHFKYNVLKMNDDGLLLSN